MEAVVLKAWRRRRVGAGEVMVDGIRMKTLE